MRLATTCPHCKTTFAITAAQLRASRGHVQCSLCSGTFDALDSLTEHQSSLTLGALVPLGTAEPAHAASEEEPYLDLERTSAAGLGDKGSVLGPTIRDGDFGLPRDDEAIAIDSSSDPTFEVFTETWSGETSLESSFESSNPPLVHQDTALQVGPGGEAERLTGVAEGLAPEAEGADAVDFFADERRASGFSSRSVLWWTLASVVLAFLLVLQVMIAARDQLAAWVPSARPALETLVAPLGLDVGPPRHLSSLTIESFDLRAEEGDGHYTLRTLMRNRAKTPVRWPAIELRLLRDDGSVVVRRVLPPQDFVTESDQLAAGMEPGSEHPIRISLTITGKTFTRFEADLFYP